MKVVSGLLASLKLAAAGTHSSSCDDGKLIINIPYDNEAGSELIGFTSHDCSESSDSSLWSYAWSDNTATLMLDIDGCNLAASLYDNPKTTRTDNQFYIAVAQVLIGATDGDDTLVFYNRTLGAECSTVQYDFIVEFDYATQIQYPGVDGCQDVIDPDTGHTECVFPAWHETFEFTLEEYTSSDFDTLVTEKHHVANQMVHLKLSSSNMHDDKKFAVKKCTVVDNDVEIYTIFSPAEGKCSNRIVGLDWGYAYEYDSMCATIEHRLFLLSEGDRSSYKLRCEVKVCDKDDVDSECNEWASCLEPNDQEDFVCYEACNGASCSVTADSHASCSGSTGWPSTTTGGDSAACDKTFVKQENWGFNTMTVNDGPFLSGEDLASITAKCDADATCIGFMFHPDLTYGHLIYGLEGDNDVAHNSWPLYLDERLIAHYNVDDATGQHVSMCYNEACACGDNGMEAEGGGGPVDMSCDGWSGSADIDVVWVDGGGYATYRWRGASDLTNVVYEYRHNSWAHDIPWGGFHAPAAWENGYWMSAHWTRGNPDYIQRLLVDGVIVAYWCDSENTQPVYTEAEMGGIDYPLRSASLETGESSP